MYKKRQKRLTTKEIEDTLNCSDAEDISEYEGNEMDDIDDPGISEQTEDEVLRSAVSLEIPEKKQYALCDFKLKLAFSLTASGKDLRKKRGRPSTDAVKVNFEKKKKCGRATKPIPEDDIRKDGIGHFPAFSANRATCKLPGCKSKVRMYCLKCNVYLCCDQKKNCFLDFHQ
ncbi:hypothetical protein O3P69_015690 [Scylla paramamosain]|uniref:PiggyBac transposable element-derived protein 4 C-terminal zinc-ribbon domain-containing protein n=1 Tax=Scylla paramamosain TaxID=85552 RepID=A0AAW0SFT3_SCYPA